MSRLIRLSRGLVGLMALQAVLGLVLASEYRDVEWIQVAWLGNDAFTLVVAVPLFALAIARASRGSVLGMLGWLGMLGYVLYNYAFYLLGASLNAFFPLYVVALVLGGGLLLVAVRRLPLEEVAGALRSPGPRRLLGSTYALVGVLLALVWLVFWALYVFRGHPLPVEREAFQVVAALDLALMVPALVASGFLLWQARTWGHVLGAIAGIQGTLYLGILSLNSVLLIRRGLAEAPGELPIWGTLLVIMALATGALFHGMRRTNP
jgi:hypothetical protein